MHKNDEIEVNAAICSNITCETVALIIESELEAESIILPAEVENSELVESGDKAGNLKKSYTMDIPKITKWILLTLVLPIMCHVNDLVSDIRLAAEYFENQKTGLGSLTLALIIFQAIASGWIGLLTHYPKWMDLFAEKKDEKLDETRLEKISKQIFEYTIVIILEWAFPCCQLLKLYYAWRIRKIQQTEDQIEDVNHYHRKMLEADRDSAVLGIVKCFLQSAPQLMLQFYVVLTQGTSISDPMWYKIISSFVTLFTFGTIMKDYHCAIRSAQTEKAVISPDGADLVLIWHLCTIGSRILVIGIAASNWLSWTCIAYVIYWFGGTLWINATENVVSVFHGKKTDSPNEAQTMGEKIRNFILSGVLASVYIFTYINLKEGPSFVRNSFYYILSFILNGIVVVCSFTLKNLTIENAGLSNGLLNIISMILFVIGIATMIVYYILFHPSSQNKTSGGQDIVEIV